MACGRCVCGYAVMDVSRNCLITTHPLYMQDEVKIEEGVEEAPVEEVVPEASVEEEVAPAEEAPVEGTEAA